MKKPLLLFSLGLFTLPASLFAQTGINPNPGVTATNTVIPVTAIVTPKIEVQPTTTRGGGPLPGLGLHRDTLVYTGGEQQYTIPCGATNVIITTYGASGANGSQGVSTSPAGLGGLGGQVTASWPGLTPGSTLYIYVGGQGSGATGGYNGGGSGSTFGNNPGPSGGGGGATDIRYPSNSASDISQIAGGGGGGGNAGYHVFGGAYTGGAGGNGGGQPGASNYDGSNGQDCIDGGLYNAPGAVGGTISTAGAAAPGCGGFLGTAGSGSIGGNGSSLANLGSSIAPNGGGGGGGYQFGYGGGGASGGSTVCNGNTMGGGGGGAAGSNYFAGTASIDEIGVWSGNGMVVIEYTIVADSANISSFTTPCVGQALNLSGSPAGGTFTVTTGPNDISGNVFTATAPTSYSIVYTATDNCGYSTNDTVSFLVTCDVNSINENESAFSISPNPAQSNVTIQTNAGIREVSVMDVTGKQLMHQTNATTSLSLDISALPAGVYFIRVTQNNGVFVKQLIKE